MKEYFKIKLEKHGGCEGCHTTCQYNGPVATTEKAEQNNGKPFNCNSKIIEAHHA